MQAGYLVTEFLQSQISISADKRFITLYIIPSGHSFSAFHLNIGSAI